MNEKLKLCQHIEIKMASDCKKVMKKHSYPDFLRWFRSCPGQFAPIRAQIKPDKDYSTKNTEGFCII